jgi:hypothetical protein
MSTNDLLAIENMAEIPTFAQLSGNVSKKEEKEKIPKTKDELCQIFGLTTGKVFDGGEYLICSY